MNDNDILILDQVKKEMEFKGWTYGESHYKDKVYPYFTIGEMEGLTHCPLFTFSYSLSRENPEWRLHRGISQWYLITFDDPLTGNDLVELFQTCSRHA